MLEKRNKLKRYIFLLVKYFFSKGKEPVFIYFVRFIQVLFLIYLFKHGNMNERQDDKLM